MLVALAGTRRGSPVVKTQAAGDTQNMCQRLKIFEFKWCRLLGKLFACQYQMARADGILIENGQMVLAHRAYGQLRVRRKKGVEVGVARATRHRLLLL